MIIPSIDMMNGQAVQLVGGEKVKIEAGNPFPIADNFSIAGEMAVIDLDAAMGTGDNTAIIKELVKKFKCRVGGGIRNKEKAIEWLDAGASKIIIGTALTKELLEGLPKERIIAALDARHGEVVVEGWKTKTGMNVIDRISEFKDYVGGFLVTTVEKEGRMEGIDRDLARQVVETAKGVRVTMAGGVSKAEDIADLDALGADVQVGMALYSGRLSLAEGILAPVRSDRQDGLFATVIADDLGRALGLAWSDRESVCEAVRLKKGVYHSRSRGLWVKGLTSGDTQDLLRIDLDCDRDAMRFVVKQRGRGFCHLGTQGCFGDDFDFQVLLDKLKDRAKNPTEGSYTNKLLNDVELLKSKLLEEAAELADASKDEAVHEAADLLYFTLTAMARADLNVKEVIDELERRSLKVTRRN